MILREYMDFKSAKRMELFSQFAVAAAREAMDQSGLDMSREDPYLVGCCVGSGIGSLQAMERENIRNWKTEVRAGSIRFWSPYDLQHGLRKRIHPLWAEGKESERGHRMCHRNPFHWRGVSQYPDRGGGRDGGRRGRGLCLSHRCGRICSPHGTLLIHRSRAVLHPL